MILQQFYLKCLAHASYVVGDEASGVAAVVDPQHAGRQPVLRERRAGVPLVPDQILKDYKVRGGKLHVAGHLNGGISAFRLAARYPQYFATLTGYPGLLEGNGVEVFAPLKSMCVFMHVGQRDDGWLGPIDVQARQLERLGHRVRFTVEPNQVHRLRAAEINLPARLLDEIESCAPARR